MQIGCPPRLSCSELALGEQTENQRYLISSPEGALFAQCQKHHTGCGCDPNHGTLIADWITSITNTKNIIGILELLVDHGLDLNACCHGNERPFHALFSRKVTAIDS